MGFKQLKPLQNICVKTDYHGSETNNPNQSIANDVFHSEDLIKYPRTSPSIYSKGDSNSNAGSGSIYPEQQHRHSIITLLQPPPSTTSTAAGAIMRRNVLPAGKGRRNSENSLALKPQTFNTGRGANMKCQNSYSSSLLVSIPGKDVKPGPGSRTAITQASQSGLIIQAGKLLANVCDDGHNNGRTITSAMKSRIPRKIRIPIFKNTTTEKAEESQSRTPLLGGMGNKGFSKNKTKCTANSRAAEDDSNWDKAAKMYGPQTTSHFPAFQPDQPNMSTTPDRTKLLMISTPPAITITSEPIEEEEPVNDHTLHQILGNFIEATSPCPSKRESLSQESIVTEFGIIDTSKCVDFGIFDFLSENHLKSIPYNTDEVEFDNSSDTDTSYLEASPPHRFSDSDFELLIEPLAITLDTSLFSSSNINIDPGRRGSGSAKSQANVLFTLRSGIDEHGHGRNNTHANSRVNIDGKKPPLRRNISLPATIFKLRLIGIGKTISSFDTSSPPLASTPTRLAMTLPRRNSGLVRSALSRLDSISSTDAADLVHGSVESLSSTSMLWSTKSVRNSFSDDEYGNPSFSSMSSSSMHDAAFEDSSDNEYVFSDIEKRAMNARNARRLLRRQDTLGNIAPPDFCNT